MRTVNIGNAQGFTLIEVILTIVIVAVVGVTMYTFLGTPMTMSSQPIGRLQTSFELQQVMENITADYKKNYPGDLAGLQLSIGAEGSTQTKYGQNIFEYTVVDNHFLKFVSNQEQLGIATDNLLKVTIKNSNNETITNIFVQ